MCRRQLRSDRLWPSGWGDVCVSRGLEFDSQGGFFSSLGKMNGESRWGDRAAVERATDRGWRKRNENVAKTGNVVVVPCNRGCDMIMIEELKYALIGLIDLIWYNIQHIMMYVRINHHDLVFNSDDEA